MWQIYSRKHLQRISIRSSRKRWVYGNKEVDLRLDLRLSYFSFGNTVVLFPCSLVTQGFKEATMGIAVCLLLCLFSCSTERSKRGECCIYGLSPVVWLQLGWCIISLRWWSFHTQLEMPLSWRCQLSAHACVQDIQRHTPTTAYISPWMYLYFRIYKLLAISYSTDYEPSYRYCLNSHHLSYNLFHNLQKEPQEP